MTNVCIEDMAAELENHLLSDMAAELENHLLSSEIFRGKYETK